MWRQECASGRGGLEEEEGGGEVPAVSNPAATRVARVGLQKPRGWLPPPDGRRGKLVTLSDLGHSLSLCGYVACFLTAVCGNFFFNPRKWMDVVCFINISCVWCSCLTCAEEETKKGMSGWVLSQTGQANLWVYLLLLNFFVVVEMILFGMLQLSTVLYVGYSGYQKCQVTNTCQNLRNQQQKEGF